MEAAYRNVVKVILKNDDKELFLNYPFSFEENVDDIVIKTQVANTNLKRGWIGDLTYETRPGVDVEDGDINSFGVQDTFRDVLLANVRIWDSDVDHVITWEYRFLKK